MIGRGLVTLFAISTCVFAAIHLVPGNFVDLFAPFQLGAEARANLVHSYGLDQPLPIQYLHWLGSLATGNFGVSLVSDRPVVDDLAERLPATAELTLMAMLFALVLGVPLGIASGLSGSPLVATLTRLLGSTGLSVPSFVLGSVLVYFFSSHTLLLTVGGYVPFLSDPIQNLRSMVLPALSLGLFTCALIMRTTRDAVRSVMPESFIDAALARGETPFQIVRRHVVRNAVGPIVTVSAISVGSLLGGTIIVENIFSIPGMGQYAVAAVNSRDYPVVQACVLVGASAYVVLNTFADLVYPLIDPRIGSRRANQ